MCEERAPARRMHPLRHDADPGFTSVADPPDRHPGGGPTGPPPSLSQVIFKEEEPNGTSD